MSEGRTTESLQLIHPVYLDTPMMVSFVAALEGGVAYGDERLERTVSGTDRDREAGAKFGLPLLSSLLRLDMSGRWAQRDREEGSEEVKVVRQHTEASLFNLLRHRLLADDQVTALRNQEQLGDLVPGQLVEMSGEVVGNPLQQLFSLLRQLLPYMGLDEDQLKKPAKTGKHAANLRSGNPATRAAAQRSSGSADDDELPLEEIIRMLFIMRDDLEASSVRDVVLRGPDGIQAVLTLSTEFFTTQTTDYVVGGQFTTLGKVTTVLGDEDAINLTRRTALGLAGPDTARDLVQAYTSDNELFVEISDPIVESPALQILPLAVFV